MLDSIVLDQHRILPCAAYLQGEYGVNGYFAGVPVKLGSSGLEEVIEINLSSEEKAMLQKSVDAVEELVGIMHGSS